MRIIGIDPGTAKTGYAVLELQGVDVPPKIIEVDCVNTSKNLPMHQRLHALHLDLYNVIEKHNPSRMVIEKLFFNANTKTAISVGQARGIYLLLAAMFNLEVYEYTALQAKLVLTGYGRSDKKVMQHAVKEFFSLDKIVKPDDANDALAIALCFLDKDCDEYGNIKAIETTKS